MGQPNTYLLWFIKKIKTQKANFFPAALDVLYQSAAVKPPQPNASIAGNTVQGLPASRVSQVTEVSCAHQCSSH